MRLKKLPSHGNLATLLTSTLATSAGERLTPEPMIQTLRLFILTYAIHSRTNYLKHRLDIYTCFSAHCQAMLAFHCDANGERLITSIQTHNISIIFQYLCNIGRARLHKSLIWDCVGEIRILKRRKDDVWRFLAVALLKTHHLSRVEIRKRPEVGATLK